MGGSQSRPHREDSCCTLSCRLPSQRDHCSVSVREGTTRVRA